LTASHRDLAKQVSEGSFREDLFYRIHVLTVELPPLRERVDDIPILAEHLLARAGREADRPVPVLPQEVMVALCKHNWPGNVRELENEMRRLLVLAPEQVVLSSLSTAVRETSGGVKARALEGDLRETIAEFERSAIEAALERAGGNKSQAARALGISRFALQRKLDKYGFETGEVSGAGEAKLEP
jgi:DNA-binding NtrC family response regulator